TLTLTGQLPYRPEYRPAPPEPAVTTPAAPAPPQFEVMYLLSGCDARGVERLRRRLSEIGESVAVAASGSGGYSVHVHCDDAGGAGEAGLACGVPSRIRISGLSGGGGAPAAGRSRGRGPLAVGGGGGAAERSAHDAGGRRQ